MEDDDEEEVDLEEEEEGEEVEEGARGRRMTRRGQGGGGERGRGGGVEGSKGWEGQRGGSWGPEGRRRKRSWRSNWRIFQERFFSCVRQQRKRQLRHCIATCAPCGQFRKCTGNLLNHCSDRVCVGELEGQQPRLINIKQDFPQIIRQDVPVFIGRN